MKHIFLALTNPTPGREADFNAWYSNFHVREVVQYGTGMRGGRRYHLSDDQRPGQEAAPWHYLAWYDLEHDDLAAYHGAAWVTERPPLTPFTGLITDDHVGWVYTPIAEPIGDASILKGNGVSQNGETKDRFLFFALTNAGAGQEESFNLWYNNHHLSEVVAKLPGFVAGRRYKASPHQRTNQPAPDFQYLAVYEVEAQNAAAVHAAAEGVKALTKAPAGALDARHLAWLFEPVGPYHGG